MGKKAGKSEPRIWKEMQRRMRGKGDKNEDNGNR